MRHSIAFTFHVLRHALVWLAAGFVCACSTVQLHDEARAKLAASGKKDYADAKVTEVIEADRKNAEFLLAAEIAAVRENSALQVDYATLEIANNKTPMGDAYKQVRARITALGFSSIAQLRATEHDAATLRNQRNSLNSILRVFEKMGVTPKCDKDFDGLELPPTLTPGQVTTLRKIYPDYRRVCAEVQSTAEPVGGFIARANAEWQNDGEIEQSEDDAPNDVAHKLPESFPSRPYFF